MYFRILGSLDVSGQTGKLKLSAPRHRTVLAMLLLEPNHIVSVDRLIEAIWDTAPPSTARTQIQICISVLRKALSDAGVPGTIKTMQPGYVIRMDGGELDLQLFNQFTASGRAAASEQHLTEAVGYFRQALGLWRGEPLADVDSLLVQSIAARLAERRLLLLEECIDLELWLGRHYWLISELLDLVAGYPLRERLRAQLITALHHAGRRAEALEAYQLARQDLIRELGLEPGEELQATHQAILADEFALARADPPPAILAVAPAEVPHMLPADITDFACHEKLVDELLKDLPATSGFPGIEIVVISGKGGVGKTTLALHTAHQLTQAYPDGQLYINIQDGDNPQRILERFLRSLGVVGSAIPSSLAECAEMYRGRLAGRRILILLDGASSEEQVFPLLPGSASGAVIVTSRSRLAGLYGARHVILDTLPTAEAILMLANMVGWERVHAEPSQALKLVKLCGGMPLALRVSSARLKARPHWTIEQLNTRLSDDTQRLDELVYAGQSMRASITVSYDSLDPVARLLFCRLAMLDVRDFPGWVAAPLLDCTPDAAEDILENLVSAQLVDVHQVADGSARFRFHDLIQIYARERLAIDDLSDDRNAALRRVLSTFLFLCDEAHRREYGGDFTLIHGDAPRRSLPMDLVDRLLAAPLEWWEGERPTLLAAISKAAQMRADEAAWDLAMSMITLFESRSYFDDWKNAHDIALAAVLQAGNRRGEAAMLYSRGTLNLFLQHHDEALAHLTSAVNLFDELGEPHGSALALRNIAFIDRISGRLEDAFAKYDSAMKVLREVGDRAGEAHILRSMGQICLETEQYDEAGRLSKRALKIADSIGNQRLLAQILNLIGDIELKRGDPSRSESIFQQVLQLVRSRGDKLGEAHALLGLGTVQTVQENYELAETSLRLAYSLCRSSGDTLTFAQVCLALGDAYRASGAWGRARASATEALQALQRLGAPLWRDRTLDLLEQIRQGNDLADLPNTTSANTKF
jgi:DNA-binding SARP family transcriptional activator